MGYLLENCTFCELTQEVISRAMLTESPNPSDYLKKVKKRDEELAKGWGQIVTPPFYSHKRREPTHKLRQLKGHFPHHPIYSIAKSRTIQTMDGANCK